MLPGIGRFLAAPDTAARILVAVGATGTNTAYAATSTDGIAWTSQTVSGGGLNSVCYAPELSLHCAVGAGGEIVTSSDNGVTWSAQTSAAVSDFNAVAWTGTSFVAAGIAGIYTSPDGVTWTARTPPYAGGGFKDITLQSGRVIAVGDDGSSGKFGYSDDDGATWTGGNISTGFYYGAVATSSIAVGVGNLGRIVTSTNGASWTSQTSGTSFGLFDVEWNGSLFCAVGPAQIRTSSDGVTWADQTGSITRNLNGIVWTGTQFVVVGSSGGPLTPRVLTSSDGITWTEQSIGLSSAGLEAVCI